MLKKTFFLSVLCLIAMPLHAQRCAVLDFQIGTGVNEEEVDALTYNFRANFNIEGYRIIPKEPMQGTIARLGFNRTDMTQQQALKVGRELEAKFIVVGTMNKFMDEYSVDIRAIDVSTGVTVATEGAAFDKSNYRETMENLAASLGRKLANPNGYGAGGAGIETTKVPGKNNSDNEPKLVEYQFADEKPSFMAGGLDVFSDWVRVRLNFPNNASWSTITRFMFPADFIIDVDGTLIEAIPHSGKADFDREALRVLSSSPRWVPGRCEGKPVRVKCSVKIIFSRNL